MAFDDRVEAMHSTLVPATREYRDSARAFLKQVEARGGTELAAGVREAARVLGAGGDIVIITDGQVSGTEAILAQARATGIRLFCLGIGSASQDRFLSLLARETGGISRFVTARERVDMTAIDLFASMGRPVASGLKASGVQPEPPNVVFAGNPILLLGETGNGSSERVDLIWDDGSTSFDVPPGDAETGETVRLLRGSRLITDYESRYPSQEAVAPLEKRKQSRVAARLLELSRTFGLASREMSLVAVVKRSGDRPGELPETRVVPVGMPQDTSFSAYFGGFADIACSLAAPPRARLHRVSHVEATLESLIDEAAVTTSSKTGLIDLAATLEPDGGMPGDSPEVRAGRTIVALLAFVAEGHTLNAGAFRLHVRRLVEFLKSVGAASDKAGWIEMALDAALTGKVPKGQWLALARERDVRWKNIETALARSFRL
jgi:hypothetical protein